MYLNFIQLKAVKYNQNIQIHYLVQLTFGISKCSVKLSKWRLNSSTLCLCVVDAIFNIFSFCCNYQTKYK